MLKSPAEVNLSIAGNLRTLRKGRKMTIKELAERSGVPYSTIKRFEHTGEISLSSLVKLAFILDCTDGFENLFVKTEISSIQEIIDGKV